MWLGEVGFWYLLVGGVGGDLGFWCFVGFGMLVKLYVGGLGVVLG